MKMYMEYLESKVENMGKVLADGGDGMRKELGVLIGREAWLQKEKINLIKKNEKLSAELDILT